jgi:L-serine dehydratase
MLNLHFSDEEGLCRAVAESGLDLDGFLLEREASISGIPRKEVEAELDRRVSISRTAIDKGISMPMNSVSSLTRGNGTRLASFEGWLVNDSLFQKALSYSIALNEVNACGGLIVAFPTAGSSGIIPGTLWAYHDSLPEGKKPSHERFRGAFAVASAIGLIIAEKASLAGAVAGCQAECGSAGAMAAGALAWLAGAGLDTLFEAAALSLKNSLGLACDPVAGLVEVPCVKRNGFIAANALVAANLALAGVRSEIPFDEVVAAMREIGEVMPSSLKETAEGGLAGTPTGKRIKEAISKENKT